MATQQQTPDARASSAEAVAASINQGTVSCYLCVSLSIVCTHGGSLSLCGSCFLLGGSFSEQLFHELEQKFIDVKSELAVVDAEKQEAIREKHAARTCWWL